MNYRLLLPNGYRTTYAEGYPLVVMLHGAIERANCYYNSCYHATPKYTVEANYPPAPKTATHKLLNNDDNLDVGGKEYLAARNQAGTRLPNDPSMPTRAFPGFVLAPQMFNIWDSLQVQDLVRMVRLLTKKYKIDENRIYIQGLSIGGYAVFEAMKRASWLFAAALPMSAVWDANIFKQNQQARVAHMPIWMFQGGKDTRPSPAFTQTIINNLKKAGALVRYSLYSDLSHTVWWRAYAQSDYYSWMLKQNKANITPFAGSTVINRSKSQYPKLMLAEGFLAYQWERNGVIISAKSNVYTATSTGTYRARFSRKSTLPTEAQWNRWSLPVTVTEVVATTTLATNTTARTSSPDDADLLTAAQEGAEELSFSVYPNPASADNLTLQWSGGGDLPVEVKLMDQLGREVYGAVFQSATLRDGQPLSLPPSAKAGVYVLMINQGNTQVRRRVVMKE
jgi:hypothetical protein